MRSQGNLYRLQPRNAPPKLDDSLENFTFESSGYKRVAEKIDALEENLVSKVDIILRKVDHPKVHVPQYAFEKKHIFSLLISTLITGGNVISLTLSLTGILAPHWLFWASLTTASAGVMFSSLLILLGVDNDRY